jgi:hypothetical protein
MLIIHICDITGLYNISVNKFKSKKNVIVKNLYDLMNEFIKSFYNSFSWDYINEEFYQKYITNFIFNQEKKITTIIFIGLNNNKYGKNKDLYYNLHAHFRFYNDNDIDPKLIVKQNFIRIINDIKNNKIIKNDIIYFKKSRNKLIKEIKNDCSIKKWVKINDKLKKDFINNGYKFMGPDDINKLMIKLVNHYNLMVSDKIYEKLLHVIYD